jgi:hypothetical protein
MRRTPVSVLVVNSVSGRQGVDKINENGLVVVSSPAALGDNFSKVGGGFVRAVCA